MRALDSMLIYIMYICKVFPKFVVSLGLVRFPNTLTMPLLKEISTGPS